MPGKIKHIIDGIISTRASGNELVAKTIRARLILKGINPDSYTSDSPDDSTLIAKLEQIAKDMGISI